MEPPNRRTFIEKLRHGGLRSILRRIAKMAYEHNVLRLYYFSPQTVRRLPKSNAMTVDSWEELCAFRCTENWHNRSEILQEFRSRLDRGEHCFTKVVDGVLAHYGWMIERQQVCTVAEVHWENVSLRPNCAVVYDCYTHPGYRGRGYYPAAMAQGLRAAAEVPGTEWILAGVLAGNRIPRMCIERWGAIWDRSFGYRRVLNVVRRWTEESAGGVADVKS